MSRTTFDDIGCDFGERLSVECSDGETFEGKLVDFDIDFDGSFGGDSVSLRLGDGRCASFIEHDIVKMVPVV